MQPADSAPGATSHNSQHNTGSPGNGEPVFLAVGHLRRPHGVRGEMRMSVLTDFPERLRAGRTVYIGAEYTAYKLRSARRSDPDLLVSFVGIENPEDAGILRNQMVYVKAGSLPQLPDGEYYHHQIIGLRVVSDDGRELGIVSEVLETGANDVFVVRRENAAEGLLPNIDDVILTIDLAAKPLHVHLIPGLIPDETAE